MQQRDPISTVFYLMHMQTARYLARAGMAIESHFGRVPQDIEGGVIARNAEDARDIGRGTQIYIFQSRPQL